LSCRGRASEISAGKRGARACLGRIPDGGSDGTRRKTIQAVEKVLKEPVAAQFSEQAWKIRTSLFIASTIALVVALANLRINADSSILGLRFTGLSDPVIRFTLAAIILYLLFHFVWVSRDSFLEWKLRITGTRSAFPRVASSQ
jgi:hypothetical protein